MWEVKVCERSESLPSFPGVVAALLQASHRYGLNLVDGGLPAGSLAQGLDVIDVMRNVHLLATQCLGEIQRNPKTNLALKHPLLRHNWSQTWKKLKVFRILLGLETFHVGDYIYMLLLSLTLCQWCQCLVRYCYSLHQQFFTQAAHGDAKIRTITVEHLTASIRVHGYGVINTAVNYSVGFLKKKLEVPKPVPKPHSNICQSMR